MKPRIVHTDNNISATAIYESPTIKTYSSNELLELIGPVEAFSGKTEEIDDFMGSSGYYSPEDKMA